MSEILVHKGSTQIITQEASVAPMALLQMAIQQGADIDKLEKLMLMHERWEANEARKAFNAAMAKFKDNPPHIRKNKDVSYTTDKVTTAYSHATLDHVCDQVTAALSVVGISHKWKPSQQGPIISITCTLTHAMGHSEDTTLSAPPDASGGKNSIQAIGSTVTYLERYTLLGAVGMAAGLDDDGKGASASKEMDLAEFDRIKVLIENAPNRSALKDLYMSALKTANVIGDQAAIRAFGTAKGKRYRELA